MRLAVTGLGGGLRRGAGLAAGAAAAPFRRRGGALAGSSRRPSASRRRRCSSGGSRRHCSGRGRLFGHDRRRDDRHHRQFRRAGNRPAAFRQLERRHMHQIVEIHAAARSIVIDSGMSSAGAIDLDRMQHQIDRAALLQSGRCFAIGDMDRDADAHARARRKAGRKNRA